MTTTIDGLVTLAAQLLSAQASDGSYLTNAGPRVYEPRDWPTWDNLYPAIFLSGPAERKRSLGSSGAPEYEVTGTLRATARDSQTAASQDGNAGLLLASLGMLKRQIEVGLINNPALMVLLEQYGEVRSSIAFKSAEKHLGEVEMEIDLDFYQGPEDFFPIVGVELTQVTLTTQFPTPLGPNVGLDITLTE
jgi:hypothetical protein